jgi:hypothetical protein
LVGFEDLLRAELNATGLDTEAELLLEDCPLLLLQLGEPDFGLLNETDVATTAVSPAASGPAGTSFEGQVGATYLLTMLIGAEPRGLPGTTIDRVELRPEARVVCAWCIGDSLHQPPCS